MKHYFHILSKKEMTSHTNKTNKSTRHHVIGNEKQSVPICPCQHVQKRTKRAKFWALLQRASCLDLEETVGGTSTLRIRDVSSFRCTFMWHLLTHRASLCRTKDGLSASRRRDHLHPCLRQVHLSMCFTRFTYREGSAGL